MSKNCKVYDPKFKAKVAIEALKGEASILEISKSHNVAKTNVLDWKNKLIECADNIFVLPHERDKKMKELRKELELMHKIIGEVTVENNFLKKS